MCAGVYSAPLTEWLTLSHVLYLLIMGEVYCNSMVDPGFLKGLRAVFFMSCQPSQSATAMLQHTPSKSPLDINFSFCFPLFLGEGVGLLAVISKHFITVS